MRDALSIAVPESAIERRQARVSSSVARRRLRVSALKVMAMRRLSDGGLSSDQLREALHASSAPKSPKAATADSTPGVDVVPPSTESLRALEELESKSGQSKDFRARRLSDSSTVSYKSDDMAPRML